MHNTRPILAAWPTLLLLGYLPAIKGLKGFGLPGWWFFAFFYGGGLLLSVVILRREGGWPSLAPLLQRPLRGIWVGLCLFGGLLALAAFLLLFPPLQPLLPLWLYDLIALFDPFSLYIAFGTGEWGADPPDFLRAILGAIAEEWLFRGVLLWGLLHRTGWGTAAWADTRVWGALMAVNAYFAVLHWPQPWPSILVAFLGGITLSFLLIRHRNLWTLGVLHLLFNIKMLVG